MYSRLFQAFSKLGLSAETVTARGKKRLFFIHMYSRLFQAFSKLGLSAETVTAREKKPGFFSIFSRTVFTQLNAWKRLHVFLTIYGYITNSQKEQLPCGLIAQLVEHCIGIAEVMGSNPVQA